MSTSTCVSIVGALGVSASAFAGTFFGPTPYLSFADSPFNGGAYSSFFVEDFEDGLVNTPGLTAPLGVVNGPGVFSDSVDGDDGVIDGSGNGGRGFYSGGTTSVLSFNFAAVGGVYPVSAGVVWTDVGDVLSGTFGFGVVYIEAFGPGGASLGATTPVVLGDGDFRGGTAEDRFFGVTDAGGISRLDIFTQNSVDWEVDHVQYGYVVPSPGGMVLAGAAGVVMWRRRR